MNGKDFPISKVKAEDREPSIAAARETGGEGWGPREERYLWSEKSLWGFLRGKPRGFLNLLILLYVPLDIFVGDSQAMLEPLLKLGR